MKLCVWALALLYFISSLAAEEVPRRPLIFDASQIQFSQRVETIFKAHCFSLVGAANTYEREQKPTVLTQLHKYMCQKKLVQLLQESQSQIQEICEADEVQKAFRQAWEKNEVGADFDTRLLCWKEFVNKLCENKYATRKEKIPEVWFPAQGSGSRIRNFIVKNADIELSEMQKKYVIADKVVSYLLFALIEQHDKESSNFLLAERHAPQKQLNQGN